MAVGEPLAQALASGLPRCLRNMFAVCAGEGYMGRGAFARVSAPLDAAGSPTPPAGRRLGRTRIAPPGSDLPGPARHPAGWRFPETPDLCWRRWEVEGGGGGRCGCSEERRQTPKSWTKNVG